MTLYLPDVSEFQPGTNPAGIKKQNGGAMIIRAGYGYAHKDHVFDSLRSKAHSAGIRSLGIYHYVVASQNITTQANQFCAWVGKRHPSEWFCIDLEEGSGNQLSRAHTWMDIVTKKLGGFVTVYSGNYFIGAHGLSSLYTSGQAWVAAYGSTPTYKYMLHQYSDGKYAPKISWSGAGYCDTSKFNGTIDQFVALTTGGAAVSPKDDVDMPDGISLQCTSQKVEKDKPCWVWWNVENDDGGKQHSANYPGILTNAKFADLIANVNGVPGSFYLVAHNMKTGKDRMYGSAVHLTGDHDNGIGAIYSNEHIYLKFVPTEDGTITAWVRGNFWK